MRSSRSHGQEGESRAPAARSEPTQQQQTKIFSVHSRLGENLGTFISSLASNSHLHAEAAAILFLQYKSKALAGWFDLECSGYRRGRRTSEGPYVDVASKALTTYRGRVSGLRF